MSRKTQHHDRHDERVVGAEQPFEGDERRDGYEIGSLNVQDESKKEEVKPSSYREVCFRTLT